MTTKSDAAQANDEPTIVSLLLRWRAYAMEVDPQLNGKDARVFVDTGMFLTARQLKAKERDFEYTPCQQCGGTWFKTDASQETKCMRCGHVKFRGDPTDLKRHE